LLLTINVFASESGVSYGDVPSTPADNAIDAFKDDIYAKGLYMRLDRQLAPEGNDYGTRGDAYLILKDNFLCIFVDVQSTNLIEPDADLQASTPWNTESVEVFINPGNTDDNANTIQNRYCRLAVRLYTDRSGRLRSRYGWQPVRLYRRYNRYSGCPDRGYRIMCRLVRVCFGYHCFPGKKVSINKQYYKNNTAGRKACCLTACLKLMKASN